MNIKRTIFWFQVALNILLIIAGISLSGVLLFSGGGDVLQSFLAMIKFSVWLIGAAIRSFAKAPEISIPAFVSALMFLVSMSYFAQNETEKRVAAYAVWVFPFALLLCAMAVFGAVLSGMPGQGAGH